MKEFDFVKLTLWLTVVLIVATGGAYFWLGYRTEQLRTDLKSIERYCREVGSAVGDIKKLETEKANDKAPDVNDVTGMSTYFYNQARQCRIDANIDYTLKNREPERKQGRGYEDRKYVVDFKNEKSRDQLVAFIFNVETQSRRIKLSNAKLTLEDKKAVQNVWKATLIFVRRDPVHGEAR